MLFAIILTKQVQFDIVNITCRQIELQVKIDYIVNVQLLFAKRRKKMKKASTTKNDVAEKANAPFPTRLRVLMEREHIKQGDLAEILCVTRQAANQYCLGLSFPDFEKLCKIATYFNVTTDYLLGLSDVYSQADDGINRELGLSEAAISGLKELLNDKKYGRVVPCKLVFSQLIESENFSAALMWLFKAVDKTAEYLPYESVEEQYMDDTVAGLDIAPCDVANTYFMRAQAAFSKAVNDISDEITLKSLNNPGELFITLLRNLPKEDQLRLGKYIKEQYYMAEYEETLQSSIPGKMKNSLKAAEDFLLAEIEK